RDFCSDCSNGQKPMLFIGLQGVRASWVKRSREKPDSMTGTNCIQHTRHATGCNAWEKTQILRVLVQYSG
ncbi:hypothetical protein, partial [Thiolapillus sp.]